MDRRIFHLLSTTIYFLALDAYYTPWDVKSSINSIKEAHVSWNIRRPFPVDKPTIIRLSEGFYRSNLFTLGVVGMTTFLGFFSWFLSVWDQLPPICGRFTFDLLTRIRMDSSGNPPGKRSPSEIPDVLSKSDTDFSALLAPPLLRSLNLSIFCR